MFTILSTWPESILLFLLRNSLYGAIVFLLILIMEKAQKKRSIYLRFALWTLVLLRLALPPNTASPLSIGKLISWLPAVDPTVSMHSVRSPSAVQGNGEAMTEPALNELNASHTVNEWMDRVRDHWIFIIWMIGSLFLSLITMGRAVIFMQLIRRTDPVLNDETLNLISQWKKIFRIHRSVRLVTSEEFSSSFTIGIVRPVIYIPALYFDQLTQQQIEAVIAHEMAHIRLFDALWIYLQSFFQNVYFFHPAVWITNHRIHFFRECLCDALVLSRNKISGKLYGCSLVSSIKLNHTGHRDTHPLPAFSLSKKQVQLRIKNLKEVKTMTLKNWLEIGISVILIGLLIIPLAAGQKTDAISSDIPVEHTTPALSFISPIQIGKVSSRYGMRPHPVSGVTKFHKGIDLKAPVGTEVYASQSGTVVKIDTLADGQGYGKHIRIQHDSGFSTLYTQLNEVCVKQNQAIKQGEFIGRVGSSGLSTGPHLHFEILEYDVPVDPENFIVF